MKLGILIITLLSNCSILAQTVSTNLALAQLYSGQLLDEMRSMEEEQGILNYKGLQEWTEGLISAGIYKSNRMEPPEECFIRFIYTAFNAEEGARLSRIKTGESVEEDTKELMRLVNSLVSMYPLGNGRVEKEEDRVLVFLASASAVQSDEVIKIVEARLHELDHNMRLPLLVVLAHFGVGNARKALDEFPAGVVIRKKAIFSSIVQRERRNQGMDD